MKKESGKKTVDIATIILLFIAFGVAYAMGFVLINSGTYTNYLEPRILLLISVAGLGILFAAGTCTELASRIKRQELTKGFVALFIVCVLTFVLMTVELLGVACGLTTVKAFLPNFAFIAAVVAVLGGYYESVLYASKIEALEGKTETGAEEE